MSLQSHLRPTNVLADVRETVNANRADEIAGGSTEWVPHTDGELAAIDWALGRRELSPLTSRSTVGVPDPAELDRERRIGTSMLHRQIEMDGRGRKYVSGVEATVMWILGESDSEPF